MNLMTSGAPGMLRSCSDHPTPINHIILGTLGHLGKSRGVIAAPAPALPPLAGPIKSDSTSFKDGNTDVELFEFQSPVFFTFSSGRAA